MAGFLVRGPGRMELPSNDMGRQGEEIVGIVVLEIQSVKCL